MVSVRCPQLKLHLLGTIAVSPKPGHKFQNFEDEVAKIMQSFYTFFIDLFGFLSFFCKRGCGCPILANDANGRSSFWPVSKQMNQGILLNSVDDTRIKSRFIIERHFKYTYRAVSPLCSVLTDEITTTSGKSWCTHVPFSTRSAPQTHSTQRLPCCEFLRHFSNCFNPKWELQYGSKNDSYTQPWHVRHARTMSSSTYNLDPWLSWHTSNSVHLSRVSPSDMRRMCSYSKAKWWIVWSYATVIFLTSPR